MAAGRSATAGPVDAVLILAGGTGERLGGVSKPDYVVAGRRLLDWLLVEIERVVGARRIIVIGPDDLDVPAGVELTLEDPPLGGPLAGLGAGAGLLTDLPDTAVVALATCDAPISVRLWPKLKARLAQDPDLDGVAPKTLTPKVRLQYLHGIFRLGALKKVVGQRDFPIRVAFRQLQVAFVDDSENFCLDVDTPANADELAQRFNASR